MKNVNILGIRDAATPTHFAYLLECLYFQHVHVRVQHFSQEEKRARKKSPSKRVNNMLSLFELNNI